MEHRPHAGDRVRRRRRAVQLKAYPIQGSQDEMRVTKLAGRQRRTFQPGERAGGGRVGGGEALPRVEGMTVQRGAQRCTLTALRPVSLACVGTRVLRRCASV
jgi:hypothetical protein